MLSLGTQIKQLLKKDIQLEWRQRYALNGMLLYVGSTVFVCFLSFGIRKGGLEKITWNALFWVILLFIGISAVAKSFVQESRGRQLYYYTLASPQAIILSKILYNALLMMLLALVAFVFYALILGNPIQNQALFLWNMLAGAFGFSATLTMISAIASRATHNGSLMAILGIPLLFPMLLILIKISKNAMDGLNISNSYDELLILLSLDGVMVIFSYILFPYLWRS